MALPPDPPARRRPATARVLGRVLGRLLGRLLGSAEPRLAPPSGTLAAWAREAAARVSPERIRADVDTLAGQGPRNRRAAPAAMRLAEAFVAGSFERAGWRTEVRPFAFEHAVGLRDRAEDHPGDPSVTYERLDGANVVAELPGAASAPAVLVGAHLDTVDGSPGADDNASGVAALLELARVLAGTATAARVTLAAFDMEELGGFGSRAFASALPRPADVAGAVVLECVGYGSDRPGSQALPPAVGIAYPEQVARIRRRGRVGDWTLVIHRGSSLPIAVAVAEALAGIAGPDAVITIREPTDLPVVGGLVGRVAPWAKDFVRSDHAELWRVGVPAVLLTDTADFRNPNYHRPTDTPDTLDHDRIAAIVAATAVAVWRLAGRPTGRPAGARGA
jgi:hypothetical protein